MAENKKSFVLYSDLIHTIEEVPDEIAGKLFKVILDYVNDKNPVVEDLLLKALFTPIKLQLKRDLSKWDNRAERSRENGKAGGRPITKQTQQVILEPIEPVNATVTVNANVINKQQVIESLHKSKLESATMNDIVLESEKFIANYKGKKIGNLQALCNKWMENFNSGRVVEMPAEKAKTLSSFI